MLKINKSTAALLRANLSELKSLQEAKENEQAELVAIQNKVTELEGAIYTKAKFIADRFDVYIEEYTSPPEEVPMDEETLREVDEIKKSLPTLPEAEKRYLEET